jgi:type I restriction enzyme S subunit
MQEIPVYLPQALQEQQKIADCLSSLDEVIEKQKATLAAWEELKKGLL